METYPPIYLLFLDYLIKMQDETFLPQLFSFDCVHSFDDYEQKEYKQLRVSYYLLKDQYMEAIQYLQSISPVDLDHYYRSLVIAYYYLGDYQAVLEFYSKEMPNGLLAYMAYMSYISLQRFHDADTLLIHFLDEIQKNPQIEELDIFLRFVEELSLNQSIEEL